MTMAEIKEMPVRDRILLMEELWDSLCHEPGGVASPAWHQVVLDERMELLASGEAELLTIQQVKALPR